MIWVHKIRHGNRHFQSPYQHSCIASCLQNIYKQKTNKTNDSVKTIQWVRRNIQGNHPFSFVRNFVPWNTFCYWSPASVRLNAGKTRSPISYDLKKEMQIILPSKVLPSPAYDFISSPESTILSNSPRVWASESEQLYFRYLEWVNRQWVFACLFFRSHYIPLLIGHKLEIIFSILFMSFSFFTHWGLLRGSGGDIINFFFLVWKTSFCNFTLD